jgi:hypothetical protein
MQQRRSRRRGARAARALLALVALLPAACRTTSSASPAGLQGASVTRSRCIECWELVQGGITQGLLLRYISSEDPPRTFFLVQNREHQDLGLIDNLGRAWRYVPHERESQWVATGTVLEGAGAILGLAQPILLLPIGPSTPPQGS